MCARICPGGELDLACKAGLKLGDGVGIEELGEFNMAILEFVNLSDLLAELHELHPADFGSHNEIELELAITGAGGGAIHERHAPGRTSRVVAHNRIPLGDDHNCPAEGSDIGLTDAGIILTEVSQRLQPNKLGLFDCELLQILGVHNDMCVG